MLTGLLIGVVLAAGTLHAEDQRRRTPKPDAEPPRTAADRACASLGQGYARVPGSDTCVRVGAGVRFESGGLWGR